jgi:polyphosphate kinase 2 (PPK2 family)
MSLLRTLDMTKALSDEDYTKRLAQGQSRMRELVEELRERGRSAVVAFEGWDAAGKGGAIRRLIEQADPRSYVAHGIAAPAGDDKTHHYLWRFWRRMPEKGILAIFDRTWYGRVLVERVEGFCTEAAWRRAFREINEFESQITRFGTTVVKIFVHITKEEQKRRFDERASSPLSSWKLTAEDWRNREKWDNYEEAIQEMLERTSTPYAPWTVVEGNDKNFARVKVIETVAAAMEKNFDSKPSSVVLA